MKRVAIGKMQGLMFLICLFLMVFPDVGAGKPGAPTAQLAQDVYDFGVVYEGPDIFQDIAIKNIGEADLEITRVDGG